MTDLILVDSNIIIDIITEDPVWENWSSSQIETLSQTAHFAINPIIYAEVSVSYEDIRPLEEMLKYFLKLFLPYDAAFLAGKVYDQYRKNGGNKLSPLPVFFIGAHAAVSGMSLLTRDVGHYSTYFPTVSLISPH